MKSVLEITDDKLVPKPEKIFPLPIEAAAAGIAILPPENNSPQNREISISGRLIFRNSVVPSEIVDEQSPLRAGEEGAAWNGEIGDRTLPEAYASIPVEYGGSIPWWKTFLAFVGPGIMVSVGYMDPGNWSTDIAGGSAYGYSLLFIVLLSSCIAIFLQALAVRVGYATERDLAQACRDSYPKWVVPILWITAEMAIAATDLAEVIGSAIALQLLLGIPLIAGVCLTALNVLLILLMNGRSFRVIEGAVATIVVLITVCFAIQIGMSKPEAIAVMRGYLPSAPIFTDSNQLFIAIGILGATVMPHNLYLHSSLVLTRKIDRSDTASIDRAIKYSVTEGTISLICALFVNSAILIVAAAAFHVNGYTEIVSLRDAYLLIGPVLGNSGASTIFAIALLGAGQNSTLTGTLAGQIVMEGFMHWKIRPVFRRLFTRLLAIIPAIITVAVGGDESANDLLLWSQVLLSVSLPFAVFPLVHISSSKAKMGEYANSKYTMVLAYLLAFFLLILNILGLMP